MRSRKVKEAVATIAAEQTIERRSRSSARWLRVASLLQEAARHPRFRQKLTTLLDDIGNMSVGDLAVAIDTFVRRTYDDQLDDQLRRLEPKIDRILELLQ